MNGRSKENDRNRSVASAETSGIAPSAVVDSGAELGANVIVGSGAIVAAGTVLAESVVIGPGSIVGDGSSPVVLDRSSQVGAGAVIWPGVRLGEYAQVRPGSVVERSVPPHAVVSGSPARIVSYADKRLTSQGDLAPPVGRLFDLSRVDDLRGGLMAVEFSDLPFIPRRIFTVFGVPNEEIRGEHAHRECQQFLVVVSGQVSVQVDDGISRSSIILKSADQGLYVPPMTWGVQHGFSPDAVLLVLASHPYDAADYIRDYDEFHALSETAATN